MTKMGDIVESKGRGDSVYNYHMSIVIFIEVQETPWKNIQNQIKAQDINRYASTTITNSRESSQLKCYPLQKWGSSKKMTLKRGSLKL